MSKFEPRWLETLIKKRDMERNTARILNMKCENGVGPGQNYTSEIIRVRMDVVLGSGRSTKKSLIVKRKIEKTSSLIDAFNLFGLETEVYTEVIPLMEQLMDESNDHRDYIWPDYLGGNDDMVVFKDLKEEGFIAGDRHAGLDLDHSLLVMTSLARFHAMGVALVSKGRSHFGHLPPYIMASDIPLTNKFYKGGVMMLAEVMSKEWDDKWKITAEKLMSFQRTSEKTMAELYRLDDCKLRVLNHGDCGVHNMLFKYEPDTKRPVAVRIVDYQCVHYNSYGWDLIYFLYSSTQPQVRHHHMAELLDAYHATLVSTLGLHGCLLGDVPSRDEVTAETDRLLHVGLLVSAALTPIGMADPQHAMVAEHIMDESVPFVHNRNMYLNKKYAAVVRQDLEHFLNKGIL